jgi:hypothetical protein
VKAPGETGRRFAAVASFVGGALALGIVALASARAPAVLAEVARPPAQFNSVTATPRLVIWTPTPNRATRRAVTAAARTPETSVTGQAPAGGQATSPPGQSSPDPGAGQSGESGVGGAPIGTPSGAEDVGDGDGEAGALPGGVSAGGFAYRRAAPWLPAVEDGVIAEMWARYGDPMAGAPAASRITGAAAGAPKPGVLGSIWLYVAVGLMFVCAAGWLLRALR